MPQVTISGTTYEVYVSLADAKLYLQASPRYTRWPAADDATRSKWLVEATRLFERMTWAGEVTDPDTPQPLAWPRTGVTDKDGNDVVDDAIPSFMEDGCCELAAILMENPSALTNASADKNVKSVNAKGVEVQFFAPVPGGRFPQLVQELVGFYLAAPAAVSGGAVGAFVSGTCEESQFEDSDAYDTVTP